MFNLAASPHTAHGFIGYPHCCYINTKQEKGPLSQSAECNALCRLGSLIAPADGLTSAELIARAFNDEFKLAGIYSDNGMKITGDVTKVEFGSLLEQQEEEQ